MKKIALILTILIGTIASASAACVPPAVMHDFPGTSFNMSMSTAADGNCASSVTVQSGGVASGAIASGAVASGAVVDLGAQADSAAAADTSTASLIALIKRNNQNLTTINATAAAAVPTGANVIGQVGQVSQYPFGAVPITASATGTTAATTATLAASASIKTYICGFSIRANATAAATANSTVTGTVTGTLNYTQWTAPTASGLGITEQIFAPCIPSSAINTAIAVISAAPGTGGVVSVSAWGYQL